MRRGITSWRVLPLALIAAAIPAAPASAAWREVAVRDSPRGAIATCLRATGAPGQLGLLGPLERRTAPYDLLRVTPEGVAGTDTVRLGVLEACPAVASDPSGHAVVAGLVSAARHKARAVAALAAPGSPFGEPVDLGPVGVFPDELVAAVSPRGDVVVAWTQVRVPTALDPTGGTRVVAALRPAGGAFGPPRNLGRWTPSFLETTVTAAMDAAGTATLAWAQTAANRRADRTAVRVATAPAGSSFGRPQTLGRTGYEVSTLALAVAPNGAALLAHDGGAISRFARAAGATRFASLGAVKSRTGQPASPAVAIAADGSAVLAWRTDDPNFLTTNVGVAMSERRGTGRFSRPRTVWAGEQPRDIGSSAILLEYARQGSVFAPDDQDNMRLQARLDSGGRFQLAWGLERRSSLGDTPLGVRLASGVLGRAGTRLSTLGCRCRSVNGLAPLAFPDGEPGLAFVDNASTLAGGGDESARGDGRLHLAADRSPIAAAAPPAVHVAAPRSRTLKYLEGLPVDVRCGGPCDLRAYVVDRARARGLGSATLRRAGRTRVRIDPGDTLHLAPRDGGRAQVVVRAWAPGGRRYSQASVPIVLRRAPLRPLPRLLDVHAARQGSSIVVTWRTSRPAAGAIFLVMGRARRGGRPLAVDYSDRGPKTSFRMRLRPLSGERIGSIHWVSIQIVRERPPNDSRRVTVPVTG